MPFGYSNCARGRPSAPRSRFRTPESGAPSVRFSRPGSTPGATPPSRRTLRFARGWGPASALRRKSSRPPRRFRRLARRSAPQGPLRAVPAKWARIQYPKGIAPSTALGTSHCTRHLAQHSAPGTAPGTRHRTRHPALGTRHLSLSIPAPASRSGTRASTGCLRPSRPGATTVGLFGTLAPGAA